MSEIEFEAIVDWNGTGQNGEGEMTIGEKSLRYSSPSDMGGKGIGVSPEDLLVGAVSTCYSGTLFAILVKKGLPVQRVSVRAEGLVTGFPTQTKFSQLMVHPTIVGGENSKQANYEEAAIKARDNCFIGKSISGNIDYKVGSVQVIKILLEQDKIDELVERFYSRLTKDSYFSSMFAERNIDIDKLKERQKVFISRLVNESGAGENRDDVKQIKERHPFHTNPEQAKNWLNIMEKSISEMELAHEVKGPLLTKINHLLDRMIKK